MPEIIERWLLTTWPAVGLVLLSAAVVYLAIIALTRVVGLRSFSKISSFDFAMTVAIGSLFATTIASPSVPLAQGLTAFAALYLGQLGIALLRRRTGLQRWIDNPPLLLMDGPEILHENLRTARVTVGDLQEKLRSANVLDYERVRAVVFETTGDINVLHGDPEGPALDPRLLESVRGRRPSRA